MDNKDKLCLSTLIISCINNNYCIDIKHHIDIIKVDDLGYYATISINNENIACIYVDNTKDYFTTRLDCQIAVVKWFVKNILDT